MGSDKRQYGYSALLAAERQFSRVQGHKQISILLIDLEALSPSRSVVAKYRKTP
jgi:hypothetical protein